MTKLQRLQSIRTWAKYYMLHTFPADTLNRLESSAKTTELVNKYNSLVTELKDSIEEDYQAQVKALKKTEKISN